MEHDFIHVEMDEEVEACQVGGRQKQARRVTTNDHPARVAGRVISAAACVVAVCVTLSMLRL